MPIDVKNNENAFRQNPLRLGDHQTALVLAALRHLQHAITMGQPLSYLSDILDVDSINAIDIDALCEEINCG